MRVYGYGLCDKPTPLQPKLNLPTAGYWYGIPGLWAKSFPLRFMEQRGSRSALKTEGESSGGRAELVVKSQRAASSFTTSNKVSGSGKRKPQRQ